MAESFSLVPLLVHKFHSRWKMNPVANCSELTSLQLMLAYATSPFILFNFLRSNYRLSRHLPSTSYFTIFFFTLFNFHLALRNVSLHFIHFHFIFLSINLSSVPFLLMYFYLTFYFPPSGPSSTQYFFSLFMSHSIFFLPVSRLARTISLYLR